MKCWLPLLFLLISFFAKGQVTHPVEASYAAVYLPNEVTGSSSLLASYIQQHYPNNDKRVEAAYQWVTSNIRYDKDSMLYINWSKNNEEKIAATLRRKKGVCDNFASVFTDIVVRMNIPAYTVTGLTKSNNNTASIAHSWCAVQLNNEWFLCDPTWDVGYNNNYNYFLKSPESFIVTHYPFDPLWQLLAQPLSLREFERGTGSNKKETVFNVQDSVKAFLAMNNLQQLEATAQRMKATAAEKDLIKTWYSYHNMNIAIIYGEQDMELYNDAVLYLNKANDCINKFVAYRNNFFKPEKPADKITEMLQPADSLISNAYKKIKGIGLVKENFQYDTGELKEKLEQAEKKLKQQRDFLQTYLNSPPGQRQTIFYQ